MKSFIVSATFLVLVLALEVPSRASAIEGQSIGSVFQCAHDFRGKVFVKNEREITIQGLNYDGKGPAAWFHGQLRGSKGIYTTDPEKYMTLPYPNAVCDRLKPGRSYTDEDVSLILPVSIKEFQTIGILCYQYCHNFGHIVVPSDLNVTAAPADLLQTNKCPPPDYATCSLAKTRHSEIKPDCKAGAGQLLPSTVGLIAGGILAMTLFTIRN